MTTPRHASGCSADETRSLLPATSLFRSLSDPARLALLQHLAPR
jgi:hypothetical protein